MPLCSTCSANGEEHRCAKVITTWPDPRTGVSKDTCEHCDPDFRLDKMRSPTDQKLWLMADVNPNEYEVGRDGVRRMKDWADDEFGQRLARNPDEEYTADQIEEAKARKRAQALAARKRPLSEGEVRQLDALYKSPGTETIQ